MKKVLTIFLLCILAVSSAGAVETNDMSRETIRQEFKVAQEDPEKVKELLETIAPSVVSNNRAPAYLTAYYGALLGLEAKFAFNPLGKLGFLKRCLKWLDEAVKRDSEDLEARFVRFSSLHYLPPLLSIPRKRSEDISFLVFSLLDEDFSKVDEQTQKEMIIFMIKSNRLNREQSKKLEELLFNYSQ